MGSIDEMHLDRYKSIEISSEKEHSGASFFFARKFLPNALDIYRAIVIFSGLPPRPSLG